MNTIDANGWSALHHAAHTGDLGSAIALVEGGSKINALSNQQRTPLHLAASMNHVEVVQYLLDKGADLEAPDELKCTPLALACKRGCLEAM